MTENKPWLVETFATLLKKCSDECGDKTAIILHDADKDVEVTYTNLYYSVIELQDFFTSNFNLAHIGILGENSSEWFVVFLGILCSACIAVPLENELPVSEVLKRLKFSDCTALFLSEDYMDYKEFLEENGIKVFSLSYITRVVKEVINSSKPLDKELKNLTKPDLPAAIVFTSGTNGESKGCVLSHKGLLANAFCTRNFFPNEQLYSGLNPLPLYHIFPLSDAIAAILVYRITGYTCPIKDMVKTFRKYKPNLILAVPLMIEKIYEKIKNIPRILIKMYLRGRHIYFFCGGASLSIDVQKAMYKKGFPVIQGYGMSECSPIISADTINKGLHFGSVGVASDCCTVKINEPDENGIGEIIVSGDNLMIEYYKNPEATADTIRDGVLYTGDLGYIDKDGYLYLTGRKKNLIILSNGKNVSPEELEGKFLNYSYINEVSVYEKDGEIVGEFYINKKDYPQAEVQLKKDVLSVNKALPRYKNIVKTIVRDVPFERKTTMKTSKRVH